MKNTISFIVFAAITLLSSCTHNNTANDRFSYTLIPVKQGDKWGYIDHEGKMVINPQFNKAFLFVDGMAAVEDGGGKEGYIGPDGKFLINPQYKHASDFSEGLAFVTPENGDPTCIDKKGTVQFTLTGVDYVDRYTDGLAYIHIHNKYGCINKKGETVINPQFDAVQSFSDGMAAIGMIDNSTRRVHWGFIDNTGKIIINPQFMQRASFSEGLAGVGDSSEYGYIDKKGTYVINPVYDSAMPFSEGLAAVKQGDKWGYINKENKIVVNPQFDKATPFSNGVAAVSSGKDNWGYINKDGKYTINPQFRSASCFFTDFAVVAGSNDKIGIINKEGKYLANPQFDDIFCQYVSGIHEFIGHQNNEVTITDQLDVAGIVKGLLENCGPGVFRGMNKRTTAHDVTTNPANGRLSMSSGNEFSLIGSFLKDLPSQTYIYGTEFHFDRKVSYGENTIDGAAVLVTVRYSIGLQDWGAAYKKEKEIIDGIKNELIKRCNGSETPDNLNSTPSITMAAAVAVENYSKAGVPMTQVFCPHLFFEIYYNKDGIYLQVWPW